MGLYRHSGVNSVDDGIDTSTGFCPERQHNRNPPWMTAWWKTHRVRETLAASSDGWGNVVSQEKPSPGLERSEAAVDHWRSLTWHSRQIHRAMPTASLRCHSDKYNETKRQQPKCVYVPLTTGLGSKCYLAFTEPLPNSLPLGLLSRTKYFSHIGLCQILTQNRCEPVSVVPRGLLLPREPSLKGKQKVSSWEKALRVEF